MEVRTLTVEINVDGPFCSKGNKRCRFLRETTMSNEICDLFRKRVERDGLAKAYRRLAECMDSDTYYNK